MKPERISRRHPKHDASVMQEARLCLIAGRKRITSRGRQGFVPGRPFLVRLSLIIGFYVPAGST
jgi:hypothetical protein